MKIFFSAQKYKYNELTLLITIAITFIAINVVWLLLFRQDTLLDIDEAGYLSISFANYYAFINHGFISWIKSIGSFGGIQAPVTTALSSLVYVIFGPKIFVGFLVIIFFGVITIVTSYYLGKFIGGKHLGFITCILVASSPIVINFARDYTFALPAAAMTTLALLALLRSEQFTNMKWSMIFGLCLGLMPLTRTMTIAFIPGLLLPAILYVVVKSDNRFSKIKNLGVSLVVGIVVAATWLIPNGSLVWDYLTSFGYGDRVAEYAKTYSMLYGLESGVRGLLQNLVSWLDTIKYLASIIYFPSLSLILIGWILLFIAFLKLNFSKGWKQASFITINSKMLPIVLLVIEGLIAITSTQNKGSGYPLPLIPPMFLIFGWSILQLSDSKIYKNIVMGMVFIVATASFIPLISLTLPVAKIWMIKLPIYGSVKVTDGNGNIQRYESNAGYHTQNPNIPINAYVAKLWADASVKTAQELTYLSKQYAPLIAFGFRNHLCNVNTVSLQQLLAGRNALPLTQVEPAVTGDSKTGYFKWLTKGDAANANILVTASGTQGDFFPVINNRHMEEAAKTANFVPVSHLALPNNRIVTFWARQQLHKSVNNLSIANY